jgi:hypothetical protein
MKNLITLALVLASTSAFATRARVTALGNSPHLTDVTYVYGNATWMMTLADSLTIESGATANNFATAGAAPNATNTSNVSLGSEGLMIRSMGDAKFALGLGHDDSTVFANRGLANTAAVNAALVWNIKPQQNPLFLAYAMKMGDMSVGAGLRYSNFDDKKNDEKESSMALNFGARSAAWDVALDLGLTDEWKTGTTNAQPSDSYKGKSAISLTGGYNVTETMYVNAGFKTGGAKLEDAATEVADIAYTNITVGVTESIKKDGAEFFYGAGLLSASTEEKKSDTKITAMKMPLIIGLEAEANSWLTLRGSVTQTLLLVDSDKTATAGVASVETSPGANSTTLAAGAGLKFNKVTVDGSILAGGSQVINATAGNLLGQVGLTYAF